MPNAECRVPNNRPIRLINKKKIVHSVVSCGNTVSRTHNQTKAYFSNIYFIFMIADYIVYSNRNWWIANCNVGDEEKSREEKERVFGIGCVDNNIFVTVISIIIIIAWNVVITYSIERSFYTHSVFLLLQHLDADCPLLVNTYGWYFVLLVIVYMVSPHRLIIYLNLFRLGWCAKLWL